MRRCTQSLLLQLGVLACSTGVVACAARSGYVAPPGGAAEAYVIYVPEGEGLVDDLTRHFRQDGFTVARRLRGGRGPVAALITRAVRDLPDSGTGARWLYGWLRDTRSGHLLATAGVAADSLDVAREAVAGELVRALLSDLALRREPD